MTRWCLLCSAGLLSLQSCSYVITTYGFEHTTPDLPNRDFYYTAYGLTGSARATYTFTGGSMQGGTSLVDGLIADAKRDLMTEHPLQPNEVYVNWSVDEIVTESGKKSSAGPIVKRVEYQVVISADVIRFGIRPEGFILESNFATSSIAPVAQSPSTQGGAVQERASNVPMMGKSVRFTHKGKSLEGEIVKELEDSVGIYYRIRFFQGGTTKHIFRYAKDVIVIEK